MYTTWLCDAPTPLAFAATEGNPGGLLNQIVLAKDDLWCSPEKHAGVAFQVAAGMLWITVEGDARDHVVSEGQTFRTHRSTRVVAQSLCEHSRVSVQL